MSSINIRDSHVDGAVVAPAAATVIGLNELDRETSQVAAIPENANPLMAVKARLRVCVGEIELTVGELMSANVNEVFTLDRTIQQYVDLMLDQTVVARGQLVAVDGHFAVRISQVPVPLKA